MNDRAKHPHRCKDCKVAVKDLLLRLYGGVEENWAPGWSCRLDEIRAMTPIGPALEEMHDALVAYRGHASFVKSRRMPRCDFLVLGNPGFIVEYDEVQHFTEPRKIVLDRIPDGYPIGFDIDLWKRECARLRSRDNDPPYRDEQRAWYDALRDLLPPALGMGPTRRVMDASVAFCLIDPDDETALSAFQRTLIPAG